MHLLAYFVNQNVSIKILTETEINRGGTDKVFLVTFKIKLYEVLYTLSVSRLLTGRCREVIYDEF